MKTYNAAQQILIALGGNAALVAGYQGHYYADKQTPKRQKKDKLGGFSEALRNMDTENNKKRMKIEQEVVGNLNR